MNTLQIRPREHIIEIDNWQEYRRDGEQFLHTAVSAANSRNPRFTPDTLYNLVAMAIEKLIMAFLMRHGDLADNHTMLDLLRALERHIAIRPDLAGEFAYLDAFQEICAIDTYSCRTPSTADIGRITAVGREIRELLAPHLAETGS
jgi:hypothetical protein